MLGPKSCAVFLCSACANYVPFIGRKTLTVRQKTYNDIHGYYRAWVEHQFAGLWSWRVVRDIWLGPMRILSVFAMCMCASLEVRGFRGGHGKVELLFGAARVRCKYTPSN